MINRLLLILVIFFISTSYSFGYPDYLTTEEIKWLDEHRNSIKLAPDSAFEPFEYIDANGQYKGIGSEYVRLIEKALGIEFQIIKVDTWKENVALMSKGQLDVWGAAAETPQRKEFLNFSIPYYKLNTVLLVSTGHEGSYELKKGSNDKIAVMNGYYTHDYLKNHYDFDQIISFDTPEVALKAVSENKVKAMLTDTATASYYMNNLGLNNIKSGGFIEIPTAKLSLAVRKDWPILRQIIDKAISRISPEEHKSIVRKWVQINYTDKKVSGFVFDDTFWKYFAGLVIAIFLGFLIFRYQHRFLMPNRSMPIRRLMIIAIGVSLALLLWQQFQKPVSLNSPLELTPTEKEWLVNHPNLKIAPDYSFAPIEFIDGGRFKGIAADYVALLEDRLGYHFDIITINKWSDNVISAKSRGHDIWSAVAPTVQKQEYMLFTEPYLEIMSVLVVSQDDQREYDFNEMSNKVVAVVEGYFTQDYMKKNYQNVLLKPFPNALAGLRAVAFKEVDAMFIDVATASYLIEKEGLTTLKAINSIDTDYQLSFASRKDMPMLNQILKKAIQSITPEERKQIYKRWISFSLDKEQNIQKMVPVVIVLFGVGVIVFAIFIILNRSLRKMVSLKTEQLTESEQFRRQLFNLASDPMVIYNEQTIVDCNDRFLTMFQLSREEAIGKKMDDFYKIHQPDESESAEKMESMIGAVLKGDIQSFEWQFCRHDSTEFDAEVSLNEIRLGEMVYIQKSIRDITDRKLHEKMKQKQIERIQDAQHAIAELSTSKVIQSDDFTSIVQIFTSVVSSVLNVERVSIWTFNKDRTQMICEDLFLHSENRHYHGDILNVADYSEYINLISQGLPITIFDVINDPRTAEFTDDYLKSKGLTSVMDTAITVSGKNFGIISVGHVLEKRGWMDDEVAFISSISELLAQTVQNLKRLEAEAKLKLTREYVKHIVDFMPSMIIGVDATQQITQWNLQAEKITQLNIKSVIGQKLNAVIPRFSEQSQYIDKAISENETQFISSFLIHYQGESKYYNITIYPIDIESVTKAVIRIDDVTDIEKKDEQLRQSQKMEMVGTLAGGLAHDFNNVLGGIIGTVSIVKMKLMKDGCIDKDVLSGYLETIDKSGDRAANMVKQLLTVSRRQDLAMAPVDLNQTILNVVEICKNTFDKSIRINLLGLDNVAVVNADQSQIEQVFLNFCLNASQAMTLMRESTDSWGGDLNISTQIIVPDELFLKTHSEAQDLDYIVVTVADTGVGMTQDTISKIFTPFFTLKGQGAGTGLGLSMVYSIVKEHQGFVDVHSEKGVGSTFKLYMPLYKEHISMEMQPSESDVLSLSGNGLIMIVDDEEIIRMTASEILKESGYDVICVESGEEAVEIYKKEYADITAVVLDMAMPGLSGKDTYLLLKKINPEVNVLLASGFKLDERVEEVLQLGVKGFIQKPYSFETLHESLKKIL